MAPLKHLEKENPIIDACFRDFCASHGILTGSVLHLLFFYFVFSYRFPLFACKKRLWLAYEHEKHNGLVQLV